VLDGLNEIMEDLAPLVGLEKDPRWLPSEAVVRSIQPSIRILKDLRDIGEQGIVFIQDLRSSV